jgi:hypothetical protein
MNPITGILLAPFTLPVKGLFYVFNKVLEQADHEFNDPVQIRATLVDLQRRLDAGELSLQRYDSAEAVLLSRLDGIEERRTAGQEVTRASNRPANPRTDVKSTQDERE